MEKPVFVPMQMSQRHASALLEQLRQQFRQQLQDLWWCDDFSRVPETQRLNTIITSRPHIAAQRIAIGALKAALGTNQ
ncbi:conserved hypothetical protein [Pseudomonas sp. OF001]|uniref:hypothetical protein n=1 Tax=Pseudomonas sp. OF001 TaxID=2772300 RepID=UPI001917F51C|nr:hypothetical protein [Pseudomonas sp. OF001]CAD5378990.1 conserved hypothetical protein [Pseudomonas sp. OF001]